MFQVFPESLADFFALVKRLSELLKQLRGPTAPEGGWPGLADLLRHIASEYTVLTDLGVAARRAVALAARIDRGETEGFAFRLEEWLDLVKEEMSERLFFGLTAEETALYANPDMSAAVAQRFPSAAKEVGDASRCLALGFPTASAYHSIRALEVVLGVMAGELKVYKGQNWHAALVQIENELRDRRQSEDAGKREWSKKWDREYSEITQHFFPLKVAQRNPVMHWSLDVVTDRQARSIRQHTIELIEAASEFLSEPTPT